VVRYTVHGAWDKGLVLLPGDVPKDKLPTAAAALAVRVSVPVGAVITGWSWPVGAVITGWSWPNRKAAAR
jgi:hypothetical protein